MGETFDTARRLGDGLASVADVEQYVAACRSLGYQHPDLTSHAGQVRDWYTAEEGMDLLALDSDCAALSAAIAAVDEALTRQEDQLGSLPSAWWGRGADVSREFLRRHGEASARAVTALRTAADTLADLRDRLWHAVDGKVAAVLTIDGSVQARRADWLAAAATVTTGAGDRAAASELVDHEVKPFVANVIGDQWLTAMGAAVDEIEAAYDEATAELTSGAESTFEVPGELGPTWAPESTGGHESTAPATVSAPAQAVSPAAPAMPTPVAPAAWSVPAAAPASVAPPAAGVPPALPPESAPAAPAMPSAPGIPSAPAMPSGGGLPDIGSGLSGFGNQLGEILGGLLGDADGALDDQPEIDKPELDEPELDDAELDESEGLGEDDEDPASDDLVEDDDDPADDEPVEEDADAPTDPDAPSDPAAEPTCEPPAAVVDTSGNAPTSPPAPVATPAAEPPPPPAASTADSGTPCEIAADELPQVGE